MKESSMAFFKECLIPFSIIIVNGMLNSPSISLGVNQFHILILKNEPIQAGAPLGSIECATKSGWINE